MVHFFHSHINTIFFSQKVCSYFSWYRPETTTNIWQMWGVLCTGNAHHLSPAQRQVSGIVTEHQGRQLHGGQCHRPPSGWRSCCCRLSACEHRHTESPLSLSFMPRLIILLGNIFLRHGIAVWKNTHVLLFSVIFLLCVFSFTIYLPRTPHMLLWLLNRASHCFEKGSPDACRARARAWGWPEFLPVLSSCKAAGRSFRPLPVWCVKSSPPDHSCSHCKQFSSTFLLSEPSLCQPAALPPG